MTRRFTTAILRVVARLFFRRIEIVGWENVPSDAPVIFAVNHPNALVDPLFLLCFTPRPVSFLAKAPLFRMPLVGWLVRAFESIPVYRREDNVDTSKTRETFAEARAVLARGGAIAIFPEGTTHSDPRLKQLKTGAARIALGASLPNVVIVPTGLFYTQKETFRSSAAVYFGAPIQVSLSVDGPAEAGRYTGREVWVPASAGTLDGEPAAERVIELTKQIEEGLSAVTVQADSRSALDLIDRADRIFRLGRGDLAEALDMRKRFVTGYAWLCEHDPARLAQLASRVERFESELGAARLEPRELVAPTFARSAATIAILLVATPLAVIGAVIHYPVYALIRLLVSLFGKDEELIATQKVVGGLVLYPMTWLACSALAWWRFGAPIGVAVLIALPLLGYVALRFFEQLDDVVGRTRALTWRVARRSAYLRLLAQQRVIHDEIVELNERLP